jgi:hypothetical protein
LEQIRLGFIVLSATAVKISKDAQCSQETVVPFADKLALSFQRLEQQALGLLVPALCRIDMTQERLGL